MDFLWGFLVGGIWHSKFWGSPGIADVSSDISVCDLILT